MPCAKHRLSTVSLLSSDSERCHSSASQLHFSEKKQSEHGKLFVTMIFFIRVKK